MSSSQHPVALRLERVVGDSGKLLATVMLLPLVDGIFPALVLAGAMDTYAGILQVGLLVFGGSATVAVILAEMDGTRREHVRTVLLVGSVLVALAALEAALAPTIEGLVNLVIFERFAALVIAAVAAKTASARVGEYLPRPAVIVGLGLVASLDPAGATLVVQVEPRTVAHAAAAGLVGVGFALGVALAGPRLRSVVHLDRFRFGSAVALGLLALSILWLQYEVAPLVVLAVSAVFAYDPGPGSGAGDASSAPEPAMADGGDAVADDGGSDDEDATSASDDEDATSASDDEDAMDDSDDDALAATADGSGTEEDADSPPVAPADDVETQVRDAWGAEDVSDPDASEQDDDERPPWL